MRIYCFVFLLISPVLIYPQITPGNYFSGYLDLGGGITYILYENGYYAYEHSSCTFEHTRTGKYMLKNDSTIFNIPCKDSLIAGILTDSANFLDSLYITLGRPFRRQFTDSDLEQRLKIKIYLNDSLTYELLEMSPFSLHNFSLSKKNIGEKISLKCVVNESLQVIYALPKDKNIIHFGIDRINERFNSFRPYSIDSAEFLHKFKRTNR